MNFLIALFVILGSIAGITNLWIKYILHKNGYDVSLMNTGFGEYVKFYKYLKSQGVGKVMYSWLFYCSILSLILCIIAFGLLFYKLLSSPLLSKV